MNRFDGKIAVVTGGSGGIGLACARRLAADGATVVILGRRQETLDEAVAAIGNGAVGVQGDVMSLPDLDKLFATVKDRFGALDFLICNAGGTGGGALDTCTEEAFDALMDWNVKSVFFTAQKALPLLRPFASIVVIGSVAGEITLPGGSVYAATKAALVGFVKSWSADLAPRDIRVNLLGPGYTETPLLSRLQSSDAAMAKFEHFVNDRTTMKRRGKPEEVASVAAFLCSDDASYMTGGVIYADGGGHNW